MDGETTIGDAASAVDAGIFVDTGAAILDVAIVVFLGLGDEVIFERDVAAVSNTVFGKGDGVAIDTDAGVDLGNGDDPIFEIGEGVVCETGVDARLVRDTRGAGGLCDTGFNMVLDFDDGVVFGTPAAVVFEKETEVTFDTEPGTTLDDDAAFDNNS